MFRRRIIDANKGRPAVPVFRYFVVIGCCLLGLLFALDYFVSKEPAAVKVAASTPSDGGSLASWRQSQERLDKPQVAPVVYPTMAPLPPTPDRLQWERQLTFRQAVDPAPPAREAANPAPPASPALQARAELPATAAEAIAPRATHTKSVARNHPRPKTVARAERRDRPNYAAAYPPAPLSQFGGSYYRQAQFDRPFGGGFFGRMF